MAEIICDEHPVTVKRLGMDDRFGGTAKLDWLLNKFGISSANIVTAIEEVISRKGRC